jgi:hypothetical protein
MSWNSMLLATAVASSNPALLVEAPDVAEITAADARMIRTLIRGQLLAFRRGDADGAYAVCSEAIQETFESAPTLMQLVTERYPALTDPRQVVFGSYAITPEGIGQMLEVVDGHGVAHQALYLVVRDAEGRWRINGCMLIETVEGALAA